MPTCTCIVYTRFNEMRRQEEAHIYMMQFLAGEGKSGCSIHYSMC